MRLELAIFVFYAICPTIYKANQLRVETAWGLGRNHFINKFTRAGHVNYATDDG